MKPWLKTLVALVAAAVFVSAVFTAGLLLGASDRGDLPIFGGLGGPDDVTQEALDTIRTRAVDVPNIDELEDASVKGIVDALQKDDHYAGYLSPDEYKDFIDYASGSRFEGIGVLLGEHKNGFVVLSVLPSTPALDAGIEPGDVIESVDGTSVEGMSSEEVTGRIKGPEGTSVALTVARGKKKLDFHITRKSIALPNVTGKVVRGNIGYVQLFGFGKGAGDQLREQVQSLIDGGADGIVLDMRDNGGGLVTEGVAVASVFIEDGEITSLKERGRPEINYDAEGDAFEDIPLVVLVNGYSASATEIVAGALHDEDRAELVGVTTFGKGSVQEVVPLSDDSAIKLTTGVYLTPDGTSLNGTGITPDVVVKGSSKQKARAFAELEAQLD